MAMEHTYMYVFILYIQSHGCWCPGTMVSQVISSQGIDLFLSKYFHSKRLHWQMVKHNSNDEADSRNLNTSQFPIAIGYTQPMIRIRARTEFIQ